MGGATLESEVKAWLPSKTNDGHGLQYIVYADGFARQVAQYISDAGFSTFAPIMIKSLAKKIAAFVNENFKNNAVTVCGWAEGVIVDAQLCDW